MACRADVGGAATAVVLELTGEIGRRSLVGAVVGVQEVDEVVEEILGGSHEGDDFEEGILEIDNQAEVIVFKIQRLINAGRESLIDLSGIVSKASYQPGLKHAMEFCSLFAGLHAPGRPCTVSMRGYMPKGESRASGMGCLRARGED